MIEPRRTDLYLDRYRAPRPDLAHRTAFLDRRRREMQTERWLALAGFAGFTFCAVWIVLDYAGVLSYMLDRIGSAIGDALGQIVAALGG